MASRGDRSRRERDVERIRRKYHSDSPASATSGAQSSSSSAGTSSVKPQPTGRRPDNQVVRHGFPHQSTVLAFDPVQRLLAIGSKTGSLRILGRPGVDTHVRHEGDPAIIQIVFLVNDGALITACGDNTINLWNIRQKIPEVSHSLRFQRERITCINLPLQSKWLYVGTDKGNVHVVNIESFAISGYIINWNKAIELTRNTHPGAVVQLADNPTDSSRLLIGYEAGLLVLWDLRARAADVRWQASERLRRLSWHADGCRLVSAHGDGSLCNWSVKSPGRPISCVFPHGRANETGKMEPCWPISNVFWLSTKNGESYTIFSGGLGKETGSSTPSVTVMLGKSTTVLEMEHNVVDFIPLVETPYASESQDPYALAVLLQQDLVVVDLLSSGYPCFENPYPMDVHESPVTCCTYLADCPGDLVPALYSVGTAKHVTTGFSEREWPITGGTWGTGGNSYPEMVITGHADGSVKFWDATGVSFQVLYKLKTSRALDRPQRSQDSETDDPFTVQQVHLCSESRQLAVAGGSIYVILYRFSRQERTYEIKSLDIRLAYESYGDLPTSPAPTELSASPRSSTTDSDKQETNPTQVRARVGSTRKSAGYQPELVCLTPCIAGPTASTAAACLSTAALGSQTSGICSLSLNSACGLLVYGTEVGLVIVDTIQKVCLLKLGAPDLYGPSDPYQRSPRSPKQKLPHEATSEQPATAATTTRSPELEQPLNGLCLSPTTGSGGGSACTLSAGGANSGATTPRGGGGGGVGGGATPRAASAAATVGDVRRCKSQERLDCQNTSQSSSLNSLDNVGAEAITCLEFGETYAKKSDTSVSTCLLVGTSFGSVLIVQIMMPRSGDRCKQALTVAPTGSIYRLNGVMQSIAVLDVAGIRIYAAAEPWREAPKDKSRSSSARTIPAAVGGDMAGGAAIGGATSTGSSECQQLVLVSDKQVRVVALPAQTCTFKLQLSDTTFAVRAQLVPIKADNYCLVCYLASGRLCTYSLPSLRPLLDIDFLPLTDLSFQTGDGGPVDPMLAIWGQQIIVVEDTATIARTFCISSFGHGLYLCSPSEIQKFTVSAEFCAQLPDMVGELFLPCEMPEPPQQGFFKGLFGGVKSLDREELFGEASGKASRSVARVLASGTALEQLNTRTMSAAGGEVGRARQLMVERGQKLSKLEDRTEQLMTDADNFSSTAHQLMLRYKDKKWYQL